MQRSEQLRALLEPAVERLGYELADLELRLGGRHGLLRLTIDCPAGVGLDDCERVSHAVSALLDVDDPIPGQYNLEVSSPGLDRRLAKPEHFDRFAGSELRLRLRALRDGRRRLRGRLLRREADEICVLVDGSEWRLPLSEIEEARLVPDWNSVKPGASRQTG
ncbi:MAG: ribosome maturation factor RimP [Gammaproteobacteria bacterium]|nr:MAG: ribosome maturation factor RimP [Gammaproteobacteria bacterium]